MLVESEQRRYPQQPIPGLGDEAFESPRLFLVQPDPLTAVVTPLDDSMRNQVESLRVCPSASQRARNPGLSA